MTQNHVSADFFLGRQPILDRDERLIGYELLFRSSSQNAASFTSGLTATATVIVNAFSELSVAESLGNSLGFINMDEDFLFSDLLELLPRNTVVLEILETVHPTPEIVARCQQLKADGFRFALDDIIHMHDDYAELMALADIIKVDVKALAPEAITELVTKLKPLGKQLLAEKVDSPEQKQHCVDLGFALFQGYYFAKPIVITGKKLSHSQVTLMTLMGLIMSDAETAELEKAFKPEPGLTVNLLRMTNSAGSGTTARITSLRHAITVFGRRQLQRWLQLLLFASSGGGGTSNPLLQLAATRGRMMELLASELHPGKTEFADQSFMTGIMSLMPALVGMPIEEIVTPLGVANEVKEALCKNCGELGDLLRLCTAAEVGEPEEVQAALEALPAISLNTLNHCLTQALAWASSINQERKET